MPSIARHLANIITLTRILGVGLIFWLTPYTTNYWQIAAILLYTLVCLTDLLDGWIARKMGIVSDVGKVLDPLADKIVVLVFLPLLEMQVITSFPVFIILTREFAIMALRVLSAKQGAIIPAQFSGKVKTALTLPTVGILMGRVHVTTVENLPTLFLPFETARLWVMSWPSWTITLLIYATVLATLWSFFGYCGSFLWHYYVQKVNGDEAKARQSIRALIPNTFSLLNLLCGFTAVIFAWHGLFNTAVVLVIFGILLDGIDGSIARKLDVQSDFGATLDSQADFISFGVVPAVVVYKILSTTAADPWNIPALLLGILYFVSVVFRLIRYRQTGHSGTFDGLPSPAGAALVIVAAISPFLSQTLPFILIALTASLLMASRIPYPHLNIARKKRFFRLLQIPAYIFTILTICSLLDLPYARDSHAYDILFLICAIYGISPISTLWKQHKT